MKPARVPVICTSISRLGSVAEAVSFNSFVDMDRVQSKPQWTFVFSSGHGFVIGKRYNIQIVEPGADGQEGS